ncbi:MAG: GAF domain-containing protein [Bdellovibrionia bacterium]
MSGSEFDLGGLLAGDESNPLLTPSAVKLTALERFVQAAGKDCSFQEFVSEILLAMMTAVQSEAASLLEVDEARRVIFFRSSVGRASDRIVDFLIPLGQGIVGQAIESRLPVVVQHAEENRAHLKAIGNAVGFETRNLVALPLVIRGQVFGVIEVINRVEQLNYSEADLEVLTYLAEMASRIIELRLMIAWAAKNSGPSSSDSG